MKKLLFILSFIPIWGALSSCHKSVDYVNIDADTLYVLIGDIDTLTVVISPDVYTISDVEWLMGDTSIAVVDAGLVHGKKAGKTMLYALADDKYDSCFIQVIPRVESIAFPKKKVKIRPGDTLNLQPSISPLEVTQDLFTWTSSDSSVAVVAKGIVTGRNAGTTVITASAGDVAASCRLTIAELTEMAKLVNSLGGDIGGDVRFSLVWNDGEEWDQNDLDAHCTVPNGNDIYYRNKVDYETKGWLDVDKIHPSYHSRAVENITWNDKDYMAPGIYHFYVDEYTYRGGSGNFRAEIEIDGKMYRYRYTGHFRGGRRVDVAKIRVDARRNIAIKHILTPKK